MVINEQLYVWVVASLSSVGTAMMHISVTTNARNSECLRVRPGLDVLDNMEVLNVYLASSTNVVIHEGFGL